MLTLEGKVAIITGSAQGMGAEHARTFVELGAKVAIADVLGEEGRTIAKELGADGEFFHLDVTEPEQWVDVADRVTAQWGPMTVLVNNTGVPGPFVQTADLTVADYLKTVAVDQHRVFYGIRTVIPGMIDAGGGSIVNISSVAGFAHVRNVPNAAYTAAKFAVRGLTRATAVEYAKKGIRVNCVMPGPVATPMMLNSGMHEVRKLVGSAAAMDRCASR